MNIAGVFTLGWTQATDTSWRVRARQRPSALSAEHGSVYLMLLLADTLRRNLELLRRATAFALFFFKDATTPDIYTLSLHDALPISLRDERRDAFHVMGHGEDVERPEPDRKSTRLNSSHQIISYAVFCLKKKKLGG